MLDQSLFLELSHMVTKMEFFIILIIASLKSMKQVFKGLDTEAPDQLA